MARCCRRETNDPDGLDREAAFFYLMTDQSVEPERPP
jgi:hypothetical protein